MSIETANSVHPCTKYSPYELRLAQAKLLALVARADGKVPDIEDMVAGSAIETLAAEDVFHLKHLYNKISLDTEQDVDLEETAALLESASFQEKLSLIRMLSSIAACDGDIRVLEQAIITKMMHALRLTTSILQAD